MRRPVRPFVTEYRGGSRRPPNQGPAPGADLFRSDAPSTAAAWAPPAAAAHEPQEDGYEAALRAADALFSGARSAAASATSPTGSGAPAGEAPSTIAPATGRILRVLDEPPSADVLEMERLEAEHAPKKRGRKPGSKNKPKVPAIAVLHAAVQPDMPPVEAATPAIPAVAVTAALAARAIAAGPRKPEAAVAGERYAWVRTRLKPGQQWKRRLPKVAW